MTGGRYNTRDNRPDNRPAADWQQRAECRNYTEQLWFADDPRNVAKAVAICNECPVAQQCADAAIDNTEMFGIWGGLTPRQLRQARSHKHRHKNDPQPAPAPPPTPSRRPAPCGTEAAYHRHRRNNQQACPGCTTAHADANRRRLDARQANRQQTNPTKEPTP